MNPTLQNSFKALADPTRRMILMHLSTKDMTIQEVSEHFDMTRAAIKKHLGILEKGNLISVHPSGRERVNKLEAKGLQSVTEWINYFDQFWDKRLGSLKEAIENDENTSE
jgi:DNA-binding transcriptional ArsR family regulator